MNKTSFLKDFIQQVWNEQDTTRLDEWIDPAYTIHLDNGDPWEGQTLDRATFKKRLQFSFGPFPDIHFDIRSSVADGDHVAISWIMTGTNLGPIGEIPATGKTIRTSGITIYHFKEDMLCGHSQVFDRTTVMVQLGFITP